jgi:lectin, mannose-binding 1
MERSTLPSLLWLIYLTTTSSAQYVLQDTLSFGHQAQLSPNGRALPNWHLSGANHQVQLLSDRVVLTPPVPGNARGALWSDHSVSSDTWMAEVDFRASGQDHGSGNLNIWFAKEKERIGTNSVYTVENYDGLALVIDQYGSTGGKIRGFLNDGTQNFKAHSSLESLAFGHCDYSYRNLGRPSKLRISNEKGLTVSVDDRECFRTDRVSLPAGYYFGVTAATSDNPDSFEISKFVVSTVSSSGAQLNAARQNSPTLEKLDRFPGSPEALPDTVAEDIKTQADQFADLHNRLQAMTHQIANLFGEFDIIRRKIDEKHDQVLSSLPAAGSSNQHGGATATDCADLRRRLEGIERIVLTVQRDVEGKDYRQHLNDMQLAIDNLKGGLTDHLPDRLGQCESICNMLVRLGN